MRSADSVGVLDSTERLTPHIINLDYSERLLSVLTPCSPSYNYIERGGREKTLQELNLPQIYSIPNLTLSTIVAGRDKIEKETSSGFFQPSMKSNICSYGNE